MASGSGSGKNDVTEQLVSATLDVSRAHLALSGMIEWAPASLRGDAVEALDTLEQALSRLREVVVQLELHGPAELDRPSHSP